MEVYIGAILVPFLLFFLGLFFKEHRKVIITISLILFVIITIIFVITKYREVESASDKIGGTQPESGCLAIGVLQPEAYIGDNEIEYSNFGEITGWYSTFGNVTGFDFQDISGDTLTSESGESLNDNFFYQDPWLIYYDVAPGIYHFSWALNKIEGHLITNIDVIYDADKTITYSGPSKDGGRNNLKTSPVFYVQTIDRTYDAYAPISFRILNKSGEPIVNTEVSISFEEGAPNWYNEILTCTDNNGYVRDSIKMQTSKDFYLTITADTVNRGMFWQEKVHIDPQTSFIPVTFREL